MSKKVICQNCDTELGVKCESGLHIKHDLKVDCFGQRIAPMTTNDNKCIFTFQCPVCGCLMQLIY